MFLDSHFGGGEKCVSCLSYLLYSCNMEENTEIDIVCDFYVRLWKYLPFSQAFVNECQIALSIHPSQAVMACLILQCQHDISIFIQTVKACDVVSSLLVQLLNGVSVDDAFGTILWQFLEKLLKERSEILYISDAMVLVDILVRNIQNHERSHTVRETNENSSLADGCFYADSANDSEERAMEAGCTSEG